MNQEKQSRSASAAVQRIALGLAYNGAAYHGWQSQPDGLTIQDQLESALGRFCALTSRIAVHCAGRTDAGVHAINQVVHFDAPLQRDVFSWVRGVNRYLPPDIAIQWAQTVPQIFHSRAHAIARRYVYVLLDSPVRPSLGQQRVGWSFRPVDENLMQMASSSLLGEHDFSSFRAAECQALSPIKQLQHIAVRRRGRLIWVEFQASAFLHHMVRNIMGCLLYIGQGSRPVEWMQEVLDAKNRKIAAPTFAADGLYFLGPVYPQEWHLPEPQFDNWLADLLL